MTTPTWRVKDRSGPPPRPVDFQDLIAKMRAAVAAMAAPRILVGHDFVKISGAMTTEYDPMELRVDYLVVFGWAEKQHSVATATVAA